MSTKRISIVAIIMFLLITLFSSVHAYSIKMDEVKAKKGEEFTVNLQMDTKTQLANGQIIYDNNKLEFVDAKQELMQYGISEDGIVSWVYVSVNPEHAVNNFEFTFKVKDNSETELKFEDMVFIDVDGNEYEMKDISGNTSVIVNKKSNLWIIIVAIAAFICFALIIVAIVKKKK